MSFTVLSHEVAGLPFSQWVQIFGSQSKAVTSPQSNLLVCYLLRLPRSQILHGDEVLDIQSSNSKLKENSLLCVPKPLHHGDTKQFCSYTSAAQADTLYY